MQIRYKAHQNLKDLRIKLGLSQSAFCKCVGLAQASISHWEKGLRRPMIEKVMLIIDFAKSKGIKVKQTDLYP